VRLAALRGLIGLLPNDPAKLVPVLTKAVSEGEPSLTAEALAAASPLGEAALPAVVEALKQPSGRGRAAAIILHLGPKAAVAAEALGQALVDKDAEVRSELLFALASLGAAAEPAQAAIVKTLDDPDPRVQAVAAYALGNIGTKAAEAAPRLRKDLESPEPLVRVASAWALVHVAPVDKQLATVTMPVLLQGLKNENVAVRRGSAEGLGVLGTHARAAIPALRAAARDTDPSVAKAATEALDRVGGLIDTPRQAPAKRLQR
jgi:HEAT repeat protein